MRVLGYFSLRVALLPFAHIAAMGCPEFCDVHGQIPWARSAEVKLVSPGHGISECPWGWERKERKPVTVAGPRLPAALLL